MLICPHLGIGDLLIAKMISVHQKMEVDRVNVPLSFVKSHRANPDNYLSFLGRFIPFLWPGATISHEEIQPIRVTAFDIDKCYIGDYLGMGVPRSSIDGDYLVVHTKVRLDNCMGNFYARDLPLIKKWASEFKTNKTIIIMGERTIEANLETNKHQIISIYNQLKRLESKNVVVDMSHDVLYSGNSNFEDFLSEVATINQASDNVCFGIGGAFNMCMAFSQSVLGYISDVQYPEADRYLVLNNKLHRNIDKFISSLYQLS